MNTLARQIMVVTFAAFLGACETHHMPSPEQLAERQQAAARTDAAHERIMRLYARQDRGEFVEPELRRALEDSTNANNAEAALVRRQRLANKAR